MISKMAKKLILSCFILAILPYIIFSQFNNFDGRYSTSWGAQITVKQRDKNTFKFDLWLVRVGDGCNGDLKGIAVRTKDNSFLFTKSLEDFQKKTNYYLTFTILNNKLVLKEKVKGDKFGIFAYHGSACTFDGEYVKGK